MNENEILALIGGAFDRAESRIREELDELSARITAQNFLLEVVYASSFEGKPDAFNSLMDSLADTNRKSSNKSMPMTSDQIEETKARIAVRLERFRDAVAQRLSQAQ
ncbi:hypothetical protein [Achromobacter spanius]|uniref:Uncharacterized protein n=1 Tax=Achromobacter spanius TaxID=217203 RepID=A0AAW3HYB6_9BURK|nr:hypothetical protein [Achromobacter spanius]KNE23864.1 hypothetical protein AFM18_26450 [Achromobacter spanius]